MRAAFFLVANGEWRVALAVNAILTAETQRITREKKPLRPLRLKQSQPQRRRRITREKKPLRSLRLCGKKQFNRRDAEE
jgi:hypothetical protein